MTTLSVLTPHFEDPEGFELSLRSIEAQTWKGDREVVVVDDGSKPETYERLVAVAEASPERVRVVRNPRNRGRPYTRNVLLDAAQGKYVAWLDSGDEWYPDKIRLQLDALYRARHLKFDRPTWATCHYDWQWAGAKKRIRRQEVEGNQINSLLVGTCRAYLWTLLGTAASFRDVGYFDLKLTRLQDLDLFLRFLTKAGMLILPATDKPLCVYHKSDLGRSGQEVLECFKYLYDKHAPLMISRSRQFRRNRMFQMYLHAARFTAHNGDTWRTALYLGSSVLHNPWGFARTMVKQRGQL